MRGQLELNSMPGYGSACKLASTAFVSLCLLLSPVTSLAQEHSTSVQDLDIHDVNGGPMPGVRSVYVHQEGSTKVTETRQSLNGSTVPAERVEERLVSDSGGVKVVERSVQRYDPNGNPLPRERQVITTTTRPDGSVSEQAALYRSDINGSMALAQRTNTDTHTSGNTVTSDVSIERPSLNASMDVVEKRDIVRTETTPGNFSQNETVYRNGQSGFYEAVRRVTEHRQQTGSTTENTAEYEPGTTGALVLNSQTTRTTTTAADGTETSEVNYLDRAVAGGVISGDNPGLKLRAQEIVERTPASGGGFREIVSVRRPAIADPGRLGAPRKISETVCRGDCSGH